MLNSSVSMVRSSLNKFWRDDEAATAAEYGLIAALIAVAIIASTRALGKQIGTLFTTITTGLKG